MMTISENCSLKNYHTFHIDVKADYLVKANTNQEIIDFLKNDYNPDLPLLLLGGGSNVLFQSDYYGYILMPLIKGIEIIREDTNHIYLQVGAGENWDEFVEHCVTNNYSGAENLSLIPGNVGTSPIQNIGAYGVEVKDIIESVEFIYLPDYSIKNLKASECSFGYRDSIFKRQLKGKTLITNVVFKLDKKPLFKLEYKGLLEEIEKYGDVNLHSIRQAIINIRNSKLPDPEKVGNAGSFFKNPLISHSQYGELKLAFPEIPSYVTENNLKKIPAGWLIEQCGWKGKRFGDAGVHENQALVLVNYGSASSSEIIELSEKIRKSVFEMFAIDIEPEVNII